ncbi:MAG TPA: extracellular solute-binding protein [Caulobacteraceae bacterium]
MLRHLAAAALALALAACGGQEPGRPITGVVNIYTARHYDADLQLYDAFTKETGIKVNRLEMEPDQLIERMKAEGPASPADVILMADAGALWRAQQAGLFQPVTTPTLEQRVPEHLRGEDHQWWGFSRRARVIAYDKAKVRPEEVATYESLASPRFRGQVCVRSSDNVYNLSLMASFIERWGADKALAWAKGVVANMARKPQGGDIDQIRAVGAGACQVALTNTYYFLRIAASKNPGDEETAARVALAFPEQATTGTHVNVSGGGLAAHAGHKAAAVQFLEFLTSDEAQAIFAGANHEYPAVEGVKPPADVEAYSHFKADPMPVAIYGQRQAQAQAVFDQAGWR